MRAYSMDLRSRVLQDRVGGMRSVDVAAKYRVSRAWVDRVHQRHRAGEAGPRQQTLILARHAHAQRLPRLHRVHLEAVEQQVVVGVRVGGIRARDCHLIEVRQPVLRPVDMAGHGDAVRHAAMGEGSQISLTELLRTRLETDAVRG